jgi:purine-binding chemotaxis protein CheW
MERRARQDPSKNLVGFVVGEVRYAVAIAAVREIVNPLALVDLPGAARDVMGVADYREEVVPVIDMRKRFGLEEKPMTRRTKWIVLDPISERDGDAARLVAIVVDAVTEVFRSDDTALRPAPAIGAGVSVRGIAGVTTYGGELVFVLDVGRIAEISEPEQPAGGAV